MSESQHRQTRRAWILLILLAVPLLVAIGSLPYFVTQDGPAHLQTSRLLIRLLSGDPTARAHAHVQPIALPNFLAQLLLGAMASVLPGRVADQAMMSLTFIGFAASILWLRQSVRGTEGLTLAVPFALIVSLGRLWLLGFYGFLLGAILFCLILGLWWRRQRASVGWTALLALLLLLAWYAHLVSWGLTLVALAVLTASRRPFARRNAIATMVAAVPSLTLAAWHFTIMLRHGGFVPQYLQSDEQSISKWLQHLKSIKLISIAPQKALPFVEDLSPLFFIAAPAFLFAIALILWTASTVKDSTTNEQRIWIRLSLLLLLGALFAPGSVGEHGGFLRERVFLLGLVCAVPAFSLGARRDRAAATVAALAFLVQSAFVWEYAIRAHEQIRPLMRVVGAIPDGSRVYVIRPHPRDRFRALPTRHAGNLLGVRRDVLVWSNYQGNLYYYPVNFNDAFIPCSHDGHCELQENWQRVDVVVIWNRNRAGDVARLPWFTTLLADDDAVRVYARHN